MKKCTQLESIKRHLKRHKKITTWDAIVNYRITRLSEYIRVLREDYDWSIQSVWTEKNDKRFVIYKLK